MRLNRYATRATMTAFQIALVIPFFFSTSESTVALVESKVRSNSPRRSSKLSSFSSIFRAASLWASSLRSMYDNTDTRASSYFSSTLTINLSIRSRTLSATPFYIIKIPRLFRGLKKQSRFLHLMVLFLKSLILFHTVLQFHLIHQSYESFDHLF